MTPAVNQREKPRLRCGACEGLGYRKVEVIAMKGPNLIETGMCQRCNGWGYLEYDRLNRDLLRKEQP